MKPNLFIDKDKGKRERKKKKDTWSLGNLERETFIDMLHNVKTAGDGKRKRRKKHNKLPI